MNHEATIEKMKEMNLNGMSFSLRNMIDTGLLKDLESAEVLTHLIDAEYDFRYNKRLERLLSAARMRYQATINDIIFSKIRNIEKSQLLHFTTGDWIRKGMSIAITGATGSGKSYLACALGNHACQNGYRVIYLNALKFFSEMKLSKSDGSYERQIRKIHKNDLLILDDFGLHPMDTLSSIILLEILEDRYERKSMIITSQYPIGVWYELIPDKTFADAICDRIIHKTEKIDLQGDTMRKKQKTSS